MLFLRLLQFGTYARRLIELLVVAALVWWFLIAMDAVNPPDWQAIGESTRAGVSMFTASWERFREGFGS